MKSRRITAILIITCWVTVGNLFAQEGPSTETISKVGTSVAQFLKLGVSARTIGMGGAFVAVANDVSTIYDNPAGLAERERIRGGVRAGRRGYRRIHCPYQTG